MKQELSSCAEFALQFIILSSVTITLADKLLTLVLLNWKYLGCQLLSDEGCCKILALPYFFVMEVTQENFS